MATVLSGSQIYAPDFYVMINGDKYPPRKSITGIEIEEDLEKPAMFRISMHEEINITTQKFTWLDDDRIKPGTELVINFGYTGLEKSGLIRGKIKALSPGFLSNGLSTLSIEGYDLSHDLQKTRVKFKDSKVTYSTVVKEIAKNNGLKTNGIESTEQDYPKVERKKNEKDYALIKRLSKEIGFECFVRNTTLYFRKPKDNIKGEVTFEFRKNFISFNPRMTSAVMVNEVKVTAWDSNKKETISENASINDIKSSVSVPDLDSIIEQSQGKKVKVKLEGRVVRSREEAKNLAIAELKRRNKGFIEGSIECIGDPQLQPGMTVNIEKVSKRFSGVYYVTKAKHSIGDGGYKTTLDVRRA
jgi:phage protein D